MKEHVIYNGKLLPKDEVLVSPNNRGMMYGDGCFDTLRSYKGKFLCLEDHFERTKAAAEYIGIEVVFDFEGFKSKILELLKANNLLDQDAVVRVQCWREGERGYFTDSSQGNWLTTCNPFFISEASLKLASVSTTVIPHKALERRFKLSNGLNYIVAARQAKEKGADDAIMLTIDGNISETTIANIFWIKDHSIYTPSIECDLFPGITRNILIEGLKEVYGIELIEGEFTFDAINEAEAAFTTNSLKEITPVHSIDGVKFDTNHDLIDRAQAYFDNFRQRNLR